jgi:D-aminopeptidase
MKPPAATGVPERVRAQPSHADRTRARELGLAPGRFSPGRHNAITDVAGVRVGHAQITSEGQSPFGRGQGRVRTGVTAVWPAEGDVYQSRVRAGSFVLNGAGELAGITQLDEWGTLETPILLTDTMSVGAVADALVQYTLESHAEIGRTSDVVIPVVGECDASWLSDVAARPITAELVRRALEGAEAGAVAEGNVGAGTGMSTCDFAGGIGTSSRRVVYEHAEYTLGVLVQSNFGSREELSMDGLPAGKLLAAAAQEKRRHSYGSIVVLVATDAPLLQRQLERLAKRAALGIARVGSHAAHGSGEIVLAFTTAQRVPRKQTSALEQLQVLVDTQLNPLFQAAIEATEEAILNAVCMGNEQRGVDDHLVPALPLARVRELATAYRNLGSSSI